jgi:AcrR family transcriptional regulator
LDEEVKAKRRYRSAVRDERRRGTRQEVLAAAMDLFAERGYGRTTVAEIARRAGVSAETVYSTVGPKPVLLQEAIEAAIKGPAGLVPPNQRGVGGLAALAPGGWVEVVRALPTPHERLRAFVHETCTILARTSPLHAVLRGAADREEIAGELRNEMLAARLALQRRIIQLLLGGHLRNGLTLSDAADRYCALSSPELHHLCLEALGWTPDQHEQWLAELAAHELLGADVG